MRRLCFSVLWAVFAVMFLWFSELKVMALPQDPDNAALLYYQAFILLPEQDQSTASALREFVDNEVEPNVDVKVYLKICQEGLKFAEVAAEKRYCDWGMCYSLGYGHQPPYLLPAERLSFLLSVDALLLAQDVRCADALERCLTARRLARHIGGELTVLYIASLRTDTRILTSFLPRILGETALSADTIKWLRDRLHTDVPPLSLDKAIRGDMELVLQMLRGRTDIWSEIRENMAQKTGSEEQTSEAQMDDRTIAYARVACFEWLESALQIVESDEVYEEKWKRLQNLISKGEEEGFATLPVAELVLDTCADAIPVTYEYRVWHEAASNALRTALQVYLTAAMTGQLPSALPGGVPGDPYSGQPFEYEKTAAGFILRCRVAPGNGDEVREFVFKLRQQ